ncbi:MAG: hypothetical protein JM58_14600 [Peptococcaceae bacterium BICA1-8]|nr:MAG: hypothetical protein JM58_14600 [Peptococcaceae bacterium BICA1-8]
MRNFFSFTKNTIHQINNKLAELCGLLLLIIMVLLTIDIVTRTLGKSLPGLTTLAVLILLAVVYLGLARCEEHDEHAAVEMIPHLLPPKWRGINIMVVNVLNLIAISIFFYVSVGSFIGSYQSKESFADVIMIPIWPSKLAIAVGLFFFAIQIMIKLIESIDHFITGKKSGWRTEKSD